MASTAHRPLYRYAEEELTVPNDAKRLIRNASFTSRTISDLGADPGVGGGSGVKSSRKSPERLPPTDEDSSEPLLEGALEDNSNRVLQRIEHTLKLITAKVRKPRLQQCPGVLCRCRHT